MKIKAPAKVNLFLEVLNKRKDGFHRINTVFEKISITDEIHVELAGGPRSITCSCENVPVSEGSLLDRTVETFIAEFSGTRPEFSVHVKKNIPVAAGLGGGSSDAAALLKAMNSITGEKVSAERMRDIAASLGSDVPFFLSESSFAVGRDRGDEIAEIDFSQKLTHIVISPPLEVLSGDMYKAWDRMNLTNTQCVDRIISAFSGSEPNISALAGNFHNDLQMVVLERFPMLKTLLQELMRTEALCGLVSGSGPSVFGVLRKEDVETVYERLRNCDLIDGSWGLFVAETW